MEDNFAFEHRSSSKLNMARPPPIDIDPNSPQQLDQVQSLSIGALDDDIRPEDLHGSHPFSHHQQQEVRRSASANVAAGSYAFSSLRQSDGSRSVRPSSTASVRRSSSVSSSRRPNSAAGRSPSPHRRIVTSPEYRGSIGLDMKGLNFDGPEDEKHIISLDNFNDDAVNVQTINSPRSVEACLRQGISPLELVKRSFEDFYEKGVLEAIQRFRFHHYEKRRQEKLRLLREERGRIMEEGFEYGEEEGAEANLDSTMIENEKKKMEKTLKANQTHIQQMKEYDKDIQMKADASNSKIERARLLDEQRKREEQEENLRREQERAEKQRMHKMQTESILRQQQQELAFRKAELEAKEEERTRLMEEKRLAMAMENAEQRARTQARVQAALESNQRMIEEQRRLFNERQKQVDQRRQEFEDYRRQQQEDAHQRAREKAEAISRAIQRNKEQEAARIAATLEKQRQAELRKMENDAAREEENRRKREEDAEKERKRLQVIANARQEEENRVQRMLARQQEKDDELEKTRQRREFERALQQEEANLRQMDKLESVERMKRIVEYQKIRTLEKIDSKVRKSQFMQDMKKQLLQERRRNADWLEQNKVQFTKGGPGPGAYIAFQELGRDAPKWKFSTNSELQRPRVLSKEHSKEYYLSQSPGHVYDIKLKPSTAQFSFSKSQRFKGPSPSAELPGPGAYDLAGRSKAVSDGKQITEIKQRQAILQSSSALRR